MLEDLFWGFIPKLDHKVILPTLDEVCVEDVFEEVSWVHKLMASQNLKM